jgi:hypothetical protein
MAALMRKVDRLATREAFDGRFPTLRRTLAKQGVGDGEGVSDMIVERASARSMSGLTAR